MQTIQPKPKNNHNRNMYKGCFRDCFAICSTQIDDNEEICFKEEL
jgi:hypothetical protein